MNPTYDYINHRPRFTIKIETDKRDTYPNDFKCWVEIIDNKTNKHLRRRGYGKFIGNFSPIWVTIDKRSFQLSELEREMF